MQEKLKSISFKICPKLVSEFRDEVKKSGYSQTFLIQKAMKRIIKELKNEKN